MEILPAQHVTALDKLGLGSKVGLNKKPSEREYCNQGFDPLSLEIFQLVY